MRSEQILFKKWKHLYFWTKLLTSWHQSVTIFLQGQFMLQSSARPPRHRHACQPNICSGAVRATATAAHKKWLYTKSSTCMKKYPPLSLFSLCEFVCFRLKIKNSGSKFAGPSVSLSLAPHWQRLHCHSWEMVSHYLHFYWCSKLQIAFLFLLSLSLRWGCGGGTLICWSRPYINHYSRVKWTELISE